MAPSPPPLAAAAPPEPAPAPAPQSAPAAAAAAAPAPAAPAADAYSSSAPAPVESRAAARPAAPAPAVAAPEATGPMPAGLATWTQARIEGSGTSIIVPRERAVRLAALVDRAARAQRTDPNTATVELSLEFGRASQVLGTLEWAGGQWSVRLTGEPRRGLALTAPLASELREEAQRLLRR